MPSAAGQIPDIQRPELEHILDLGNMWRVLLPYLKDAALLKAYMADNCAAQDFTYPDSALYARWTPKAHDAVTQGGSLVITELDVVRMCAGASSGTAAYWTCAAAPCLASFRPTALPHVSLVAGFGHRSS